MLTRQRRSRKRSTTSADFPTSSIRSAIRRAGAPELAAQAVVAAEGRGHHGRRQRLPRARSRRVGAAALDVPGRRRAGRRDSRCSPELGTARHVELGRALAPLADDDVLIVGSGHATHNLRDWMANPRRQEPLRYAQAFADWLHERLPPRDTEALIAYREQAPEGARAHPSEEHFLPLLVAWGAAGDGARVDRLQRGLRGGRARQRFVRVPSGHGARSDASAAGAPPASLRSRRFRAADAPPDPATTARRNAARVPARARRAHRRRCRRSRARTPGGSGPTSTTPGVYRISVICVQPIAPRPSACGERAHRRRAIRERMQRGASAVGDAEPPQHVDEMDAGRGALRIGEVDRGRREQRAAQRGAVGDVGQRLARAHRDAGAHATERRASCRAARARRRSSSATIASVRMTTSQGAPARSFSRIAPTAPKVALHGRHRYRRGTPPRPRRRCPARLRRIAASQRARRAPRHAHWSAFAPEILTMRSHLTMSSSR